MLFWLFLLILVIGICCIIVDKKLFETWWLDLVGLVITGVGIIAVFVSCLMMLESYGTVESKIAQNNKTYESLVYQLENDLYDNDNDLGKKELYKEIEDWNVDLAYYQNIQDNFWFGIYYPDIFDQFKYIEYEDYNKIN